MLSCKKLEYSPVQATWPVESVLNTVILFCYLLSNFLSDVLRKPLQV